MDDMIIKSNKEEMHDKQLTSVYKRIQKYNMRLNLEKCTFGWELENLWDFI